MMDRQDTVPLELVLERGERCQEEGANAHAANSLAITSNSSVGVIVGFRSFRVEEVTMINTKSTSKDVW